MTGVVFINFDALRFNPLYATVMTRIKYLRAPGRIPPADNIHALAEYAKRWYNTVQRQATVKKYIDDYPLFAK